ncbi:protein PSK SIMULATOR 1-like [Actinidia eriantha]|uniref:protein PSK SIMULATOR 1-like n=1 Tax=Actinidia eriantha TaxID=165200 RepID=UPI002586C850|nr:protein PSK SIMULATOR 1-like [Actinidia eriantha]
MVILNNTMGWLSEIGSRVGDNLKRSSSSANNNNLIGILSFETAKTMSRLLSLYKSLSVPEISKLRNETIKSEGVVYLNSNDESFLLRLACAERLEDLDKIAVTVARLGLKCSDFGLNRFDLVYTNLKLGIIDLGKLEYGSRETEKRVKKMEKLISATSRLYSALESLSEMEVSERKLKQWKLNAKAFQSQSVNSDLFNQKISHQRKQVRHYRETSLWNQTFDKSVGLMARIVCVVYARLCLVFGRDCYLFEPRKEQLIITRSGPIPTTSKPKLVRFHSQHLDIFSDSGSENRVFNFAGSDTVGGAGLSLRYANVILLAEKYLDTSVTIGDEAREDLYQMLPENLKILVKSKLSKNVRKVPAEEDGCGEGLAEGWREAMTEIMRWLTPVAHDTVRWQAERNLEKMRFESRPAALLVHTLHFSDREKVEAAVAEVLVGLSCIYRYENRRNCDGDCGDDGGASVGGRCSFDGCGWT